MNIINIVLMKHSDIRTGSKMNMSVQNGVEREDFLIVHTYYWLKFIQHPVPLDRICIYGSGCVLQEIHHHYTIITRS